MKKFAFLVAAATLAFAGTANAALIINQSPDATGFTSTFTAGNQAAGQNFLVKFTLATATALNGIDIYSRCRAVIVGCVGPSVGSPGIVKIRNDAAGAPAASNLFAISTVLSAIDNFGSSANPLIERLHADFTATPLAAGTYWIGLGGDGVEFGEEIDFSTASGGYYFGGGDSIINSLNSSRTAYNIYDNTLTGAVPEPAAWALMITGFGLAGAAMRRRRTSVKVAYA